MPMRDRIDALAEAPSIFYEVVLTSPLQAALEQFSQIASDLKP
jgi:hypothetical protein